MDFLWRKQIGKEIPLTTSIKVPVIPEAVEQYNIDGTFIREFVSAAEASIITVFRERAIKASCLGVKNAETNEYKWKYSTAPSLPQILPMNGKNVCQYDTDGNFIKCFVSSAEAARSMGFSRTAVYNTCQGIQKTTGGYMWRYAGAEYQLKIEPVEPRPHRLRVNGHTKSTYVKKSKEFFNIAYLENQLRSLER